MDEYIKKECYKAMGVEINPGEIHTHKGVIALIGPKGCGKSTAAGLLEGYGFITVKFAARLKEMLYAMGLTYEEIEGSLKEQPCGKLMGRTPRHAMQTLGTEWGRNCIGEDFWVSLWQRQVRGMIEAGGRVVCDDLRFHNEFKAVKSMGGTVIRIAGRNEDNGDAHESEAYYKYMPADVTVYNTGSVEDLRRNLLVAASLRSIYKPHEEYST